MGRVATSGIDYTSKDYTAYKEMMIAKIRENMPEYTDIGVETDAGTVIVEAFASVADIISMYNDIVANDVLLPTTQDRAIAVLLSRQLRYVPKNQTSSVIRQVFVLSDIIDEDVVIPAGTEVHTVESEDMVEIMFETDNDLTIPAGYLGNEQDEGGNYLFSVTASQGSTVTNDILGKSNGRPLQEFTLSYEDVLTDTITVLVDEGEGFEEWTQVSTFLDSGSDSKVYSVYVDEFNNCYIQFGTGTHGKIPAISTENSITASYRIGGGVVGNVQENTVIEHESDVAYVEDTFNVGIVTYGHDKETLEEIKENAQATFRTQDRAITEQDYGDLFKIHFYDYLDVVGVASTVSDLFIDIYYMMKEGYEYTDTLDEETKDMLDARIIPGTAYSIHAGVPQTLDFTASLIVDDDYNRADVLQDVEDYINDIYFAYGNFKFGDSFKKTALEHDIMDDVDGVESFRITGDASVISPNERYNYLTLGTVTINTTGGKV